MSDLNITELLARLAASYPKREQQHQIFSGNRSKTFSPQWEFNFGVGYRHERAAPIILILK